MLTICRFNEKKSLSLQIKLVIAYCTSVSSIVILKHALASLTAKLLPNCSLQLHVTCLDQSTFYIQILNGKTWNYVSYAGFGCKCSLPFPLPQSPSNVFLSSPAPPFPSLLRLLHRQDSRATLSGGGGSSTRVASIHLDVSDCAQV